MLDEPTGHWVSHAERLARDTARHAAAQYARDRAAVAAALPVLRRVVPPGWSVDVADNPAPAVRVLPAGPVDVAAYLCPPRPGTHGWRVFVHDRTRGAGAAVFAADSAHAAAFPDPLAATTAAIRHLR
ncbi:hypothetical protein BJY24_005692 [Nocardia transvalensis]|uniref:Uncharacterized protein n=1 Tax=Nocardia transvalensis TaxID=37333 RepID=A0A7W9PIZ9_9NOCA|nr:hypothetical protein [Nocardia transvalensis]MBB5916780.1 hypothetical protein [Nocardia transvalensis]